MSHTTENELVKNSIDKLCCYGDRNTISSILLLDKRKIFSLEDKDDINIINSIESCKSDFALLNIFKKADKIGTLDKENIRTILNSNGIIKIDEALNKLDGLLDGKSFKTIINHEEPYIFCIILNYLDDVNLINKEVISSVLDSKEVDQYYSVVHFFNNLKIHPDLHKSIINCKYPVELLNILKIANKIGTLNKKNIKTILNSNSIIGVNNALSKIDDLLDKKTFNTIINNEYSRYARILCMRVII